MQIVGNAMAGLPGAITRPDGSGAGFAATLGDVISAALAPAVASPLPAVTGAGFASTQRPGAGFPPQAFAGSARPVLTLTDAIPSAGNAFAMASLLGTTSSTTAIATATAAEPAASGPAPVPVPVLVPVPMPEGLSSAALAPTLVPAPASTVPPALVTMPDQNPARAMKAGTAFEAANAKSAPVVAWAAPQRATEDTASADATAPTPPPSTAMPASTEAAHATVVPLRSDARTMAANATPLPPTAEAVALETPDAVAPSAPAPAAAAPPQAPPPPPQALATPMRAATHPLAVAPPPPIAAAVPIATPSAPTSADQATPPVAVVTDGHGAVPPTASPALAQALPTPLPAAARNAALPQPSAAAPRQMPLPEQAGRESLPAPVAATPLAEQRMVASASPKASQRIVAALPHAPAQAGQGAAPTLPESLPVSTITVAPVQRGATSPRADARSPDAEPAPGVVSPDSADGTLANTDLSAMPPLPPVVPVVQAAPTVQAPPAAEGPAQQAAATDVAISSAPTVPTATPARPVSAASSEARAPAPEASAILSDAPSAAPVAPVTPTLAAQRAPLATPLAAATQAPVTAVPADAAPASVLPATPPATSAATRIDTGPAPVATATQAAPQPIRQPSTKAAKVGRDTVSPASTAPALEDAPTEAPVAGSDQTLGVAAPSHETGALPARAAEASAAAPISVAQEPAAPAPSPAAPRPRAVPPARRLASDAVTERAEPASANATDSARGAIAATPSVSAAFGAAVASPPADVSPPVAPSPEATQARGAPTTGITEAARQGDAVPQGGPQPAPTDRFMVAALDAATNPTPADPAVTAATAPARAASEVLSAGDAPRPSGAAPSPTGAMATAAPASAPVLTPLASPLMPPPRVTVSAQPGRIGRETGVAIAHRIGNSGGNEMTLHLSPASLGRIEVKIAFDDGNLRATLRADNPAALDLLRRDSPDLTRALDQAGVRSDSASLNFQSRGSDGQSGGTRQQHQQQPFGQRGEYRDAPAPIVPESYRPLRTSGRVDFLA